MASPSQVPSGFPLYKDGDLFINLGSSKEYKLHSKVLLAHAPSLQPLLLEANAAKLNNKARSLGNTVRFAFDLLYDMVNKAPALRPIPINRDGTFAVMADPHEQGLRRVDPETRRNYDNLLRAFYNEPMQVNNSNFGTVTSDAYGLLEVAKEFDVEIKVAPHVESMLLGHGQGLWKSVSHAPIVWANMAIRIHSEKIMRDCIIHIVGQWNRWLSEADAAREKIEKNSAQGAKGKGREKVEAVDPLEELDPRVLRVCRRKAWEFLEQRRCIELRTLGHYAESMTKSQRTDEKNPVARRDYASDIFMWMAVCFFRHWYSQQVSLHRTYFHEDSGFRLAKLMSKAGDAYLSRRHLEHLQAYFPMTTRSQSIIYNNLLVLKEELAKFWRPLMQNLTQLELKEGEQFDHFVSVDIQDEDMPWKDQAGPEKHRDAIKKNHGSHFPIDIDLRLVRDWWRQKRRWAEMMADTWNQELAKDGETANKKQKTAADFDFDAEMAEEDLGFFQPPPNPST